jgi:hypothetical protein
MARVSVGDDVYCEVPGVNQLEKTAAQLPSKQGEFIVSSGTGQPARDAGSLPTWRRKYQRRCLSCVPFRGASVLGGIVPTALAIF